MSAPFLQFYVADYLADTQHLTTEQHGAYLLILFAMWRAEGGELDADDGKFARIARLTLTRWNRIKGDVMALLTIESGRVTQKRLRAELQKAEEKSQKRAEAGRSGGQAKALKDKETCLANASGLPRHLPEPELEPESDQKEEGFAFGAAPPPPAAIAPPFIEIPTNRFETTKEQFPVYGPMIEEYQRLYPAVDIRCELRKMRGWAIGKPQKRKTKRGMASFINNWLAREQDKSNAPRETSGGRNGGRYQAPAHESFGAGLLRSISEDYGGQRGVAEGSGEIIDVTPSGPQDRDHDQAA